MKKYRPSACYQQQPSFNDVLKSVASLIELPPPCHSWDDFLDFSRMSLVLTPQSVKLRTQRNIFHRFKGNYMRIWILFMIIAGIIDSFWHLVSIVFLSVIWTLLCITTVVDTKAGGYMTFGSIMFRCEKMSIFAMLSHVILFLLGTLKQTYLISTSVGFFVVLHSLSRPVAMEFQPKRRSSTIASDGFIDVNDSDEGEETLVFVSTTAKAEGKIKASPGIIKRVRDITSPSVGITSNTRDTAGSTSTIIRRHAAKANLDVQFVPEAALM